MNKQQESEIKPIQAFKFAGSIYEHREDAERALARSNLREFIEQVNSFELSLGIAQQGELCQWLEKEKDKIVRLLEALH